MTLTILSIAGIGKAHDAGTDGTTFTWNVTIIHVLASYQGGKSQSEKYILGEHYFLKGLQWD